MNVQPLLKSYLALSLRDRVLAVAAVAGVLFLVAELGWVQPRQREAKLLAAALEQQAAEIAALTQALRERADKPRDALAAQRQERGQLRAEIARAESVIGPAGTDVRMGQVVRSLVATIPGVSLVSLKTLPVQTFVKAGELATTAKPASGASAAQGPQATLPVPALYRHGIEVTLQGQYLTLIPYLQALERSSKGIFWGSARFNVSSYPEATLTLTLFTLSVHPELPLG
jgi:MSHA biogenesis protein MshJ